MKTKNMTEIYSDFDKNVSKNMKSAFKNNCIESVNESLFDEYAEDVVNKMAQHGFEYDDIDSDPDGGYIVFFSENGLFPSGGFRSWEDVNDWVENVVFDESVTENLDSGRWIVREYNENGLQKETKWDDEDEAKYYAHDSHYSQVIDSVTGKVVAAYGELENRDVIVNDEIREGSEDSDNDAPIGYLITNSEGNVLTYKNGHRSFESLGEFSTVYSKEGAESALYVFSNHKGIKGLSITPLYADGTVGECCEATNSENSDSEVKGAMVRNGAKIAAKTGITKGYAKEAAKHGMKVAQKFAAKKAGTKVAAKAGVKAAAKMLGKSALKKIPLVGLGVGAKFAYDRAKEGDILGAAGELGSGVASCVPGAGTAVSLGIDAALAARDVGKAMKKTNEDTEDEYEEFPIPCEGLAKRKTIRAAHNYIYDNVLPLTKGFFKDENWESVHRIFHVLADDMGMNVNWGARNDRYYQHGYALDQSSKAYQFDAKYRNNDGKNITINGQIIASFCGTVEDPMSKYDLVFQLF